ncbi:serine/threonine-protein phosphatase [Streptomyces sp. PRB2-1]|uniref:Serine/threonine-protein phosphatase n=2 Tax=Actinacidiphila epipremni TaxID=2053013 RepID=A0ABX0ZTA6_9ACTN|nr:serine/threonine-protein phosphatase [Actinacidiphila epipremni]
MSAGVGSRRASLEAGERRTADAGSADGIASAAQAALVSLPYVVMAVVVVADVAAGPSVGLLPMTALGPAFAGLASGWRRSAFVGLLAVVACCALGIYDGLFEEKRGFTAIASVAGVTVAAVVAAMARQRREAELASVRSIAEVAQRVLLRPVPRSAGHLRVAVSYTSAVAEARIGGDLYEVVASPAGVRVIIGDVQGKGLAAVEIAAAVLGAFREAAYDEPDLPGVGERVRRTAERVVDEEKFVTAVIAEMRPGAAASVMNYGHPAPMVVSADGGASFPEPAQYAVPLGLGTGSDDAPVPFEVPMAPGDQLLLYTDGVTETRDESGGFYPLGNKAHLLLAVDADDALEALRADLVRHAGRPLHDDAAMLLLRHREWKGADGLARPDAARPAASDI